MTNRIIRFVISRPVANTCWLVIISITVAMGAIKVTGEGDFSWGLVFAPLLLYLYLVALVFMCLMVRRAFAPRRNVPRVDPLTPAEWDDLMRKHHPDWDEAVREQLDQMSPAYRETCLKRNDWYACLVVLPVHEQLKRGES